jgi:glycosyltransferase involved in cell wall biosynthesis
MPAIYDLADIFVLASHREPWGLAVNEAMNAGCAVVVSDECGCAADLVDRDCGHVVAAGSETHLADALLGLLTNPAQCAEMGLAAKRRVSHWSFDSDVDGLKTALDAVRRDIDRS